MSKTAIEDALPERMNFAPSRLRLGALLTISLVFVAIGIWMVRNGQGFGWFEIAFFGLGAVVFAASFLRGGLSLDREGFAMQVLWRSSRYAWRDVSEFSVSGVAKGSVMIVFDDLRRAGPLSDFNRSVAGRNAGIPNSIIADLEETCAILNAFRDRARARERRP